MYQFDRSDELRFRVKEIERRVEAAREIAEIRDAARADRLGIRNGLGERLVRIGARVAGVRPEATWHHLIQHSCAPE